MMSNTCFFYQLLGYSYLMPTILKRPSRLPVRLLVGHLQVSDITLPFFINQFWILF